LSAFVVAAREDGTEVVRVIDAPKALAAEMRRQRRLAKSLSRKQKGSHNRRDVAAKLGRHHNHVANVRRHFLHQVSNALVKTHGRLVIENLNVSGMLASLACSGPSPMPAGPSSPDCSATNKPGAATNSLSRIAGTRKLCPQCGAIIGDLTLADRVFTCGCGYSADRDLNAAVNLARLGLATTKPHQIPGPPSREAGPPTPADGKADQHPMCAGETSPDDAGTDVQTAPAD
jgi:putative transposase